MQTNLRIMSRKSIVHKNRMLLKNCFWPHCASLNILQFCPFCSSINVYDIDWSGFAHVDEQWVEIKSERIIPVFMHLLFHEIYVKYFLKGGSVEETLMYRLSPYSKFEFSFPVTLQSLLYKNCPSQYLSDCELV